MAEHSEGPARIEIPLVGPPSGDDAAEAHDPTGWPVQCAPNCPTPGFADYLKVLFKCRPVYLQFLATNPSST